jgi:hypothetical protein
VCEQCSRFAHLGVRLFVIGEEHTSGHNGPTNAPGVLHFADWLLICFGEPRHCARFVLRGNDKTASFGIQGLAVHISPPRVAGSASISQFFFAMPRLSSRPVQPTGPAPANNHGGARKHGVNTKDEPRTSPPRHLDVWDLYGKDDDEFMGATAPKGAPGLMPNTNGGDRDRKSASTRTTFGIVADSTSLQRQSSSYGDDCRQQQDGNPKAAAAAVNTVPNVPNPSPMELTTSLGSTRRQALLNARRQQSSQLWIAHESGLSLTGRSSTAKLLTTTPTSSNSRHQLLGMVYRAKRVFQFQPGRSRNNTDSSSTSLLSTRRFLPWHKVRRNKQQEQRAISAGGRIEHHDGLGHGVADSSSSSMLLNAAAHYDSAPSTALAASSGSNAKDELLLSNEVPPPIPRPNSLLARNASVNNYYRGEGFEIGYVDL